MATLSSNSTDAEVWAAYDDNASYEEDASRAKALKFVTACRILRRRLPLAAGRGPQSVTRESLDAEVAAARAWLDRHRTWAVGEPRGCERVRALDATSASWRYRDQRPPGFDGSHADCRAGSPGLGIAVAGRTAWIS